MKKLVSLTAGALLFAGAAIADPVLGTWRTTADDNGNYGHINVGVCNGKICGQLVKAFDGSGAEVSSDNVGKNIIWDMVPLGGGNYGKGKVWAPDRDKTYNSKMSLSGDNLAIEGCVLGICRDGGVWKRVN